ncbi:hypothetical protein A374_10505 [Fictibacillus macauensis ZFHKF-1]|uniref:DUF92 domain-containing protein n=1 Tax=Fictibacillus macauensis ZFHKF-1 TaxID=1196324 RepID=I8AHH5_9BACL|nr:DUF92 domain-containing protein [Fictibacillus macauensis]EIT85167.1 hypothetical protein A374_10505 [Fictibacillus macauensis ZFHKF-1]
MIIALLLAVAVYCAYRFSLLTGAAALCSWLIGILVYVAFSGAGLILLLFFFLSSSVIGLWGKSRKRELATLVHEKHGRTIGQVLANGGVALLAASGQCLLPHPFWLVLFVGSLAEATADTWASEVGVLAKGQPFHLLRLQRVAPGVSGAVSLLGTTAAFLGALITATVALAFFSFPSSNGWLLLSVVFGGFGGNLIDTIVGGSLQVSYHCRVCQTEVEEEIHCGHRTKRYKGWRFFDNNVVNFVSCCLGGLLAGMLFLYMQ